MNNVIYKHKFGGRARITQVSTYLGKETTFVVELLDGGENLEKTTFEISENEFHKEFKYHGINLNTTVNEIKVGSSKYKWDIKEDKDSDVSKLLDNKWNELAEKLEKGENTLVDTIYEIARLAINDHEKEKAEKLLIQLSEGLKDIKWG